MIEFKGRGHPGHEKLKARVNIGWITIYFGYLKLAIDQQTWHNPLRKVVIPGH